MTHLTVGDKVKYSGAWLRSVGIFTGALPFVEGEVTFLQPFGEGELVTISWDLHGIPDKVLASNLVKVGEVELA